MPPPPRRDWLHSQATRELLQEADAALAPADPSAVAAFLTDLCSAAASVSASVAAVSPSFVADLDVVPWLRGLAQTAGGAELAAQRLAAPLTDVAALRARQRAAARSPLAPDADAVAALAAHEPNILWWFAGAGSDLRARLPVFGLLFPQMFGVRWANRVPPIVTAFQLYRCYIVPWTALLAPLSTVFGPYLYIRRTIGWRLPFAQYLKFLRIGILAFLRPAPGSDPSSLAMKYAALAIYVALLIYGILQAFDLARSLLRVRAELAAKTDSVRAIGGVPGIPSGLAGAYALATDAALRDRVRARLADLYAADVAHLTGRLARRPRWCFPNYGGTDADGASGTRLWDLRHPALPHDRAVGNPADLSRSLIVTGPNAAGKTTYTKALAANLLLAQTLGVVCALRADLAPLEAFGSFVRVSDAVGEASLYQAEVQRCSDLCAQATALSAAGRRAVYILDEPMRSTPPTEGAATAAAVVQYLSRLPGIRIVLTSHFAAVTDLAQNDPDRLINVSMAADPAPAPAPAPSAPAFTFSYRLRRGPSFQCIALELLQATGKNPLPPAVLASAIEIKNKICAGIVSK